MINRLKTNPWLGVFVGVALLLVLWRWPAVGAVLIGGIALLVSLKSLKFAYFFAALTLVVGQLLRIPLPGLEGGAVLPLDIGVLFVLLSLLFNYKEKLIALFADRRLWIWFGFLGLSLTGYIAILSHFQPSDLLVGLSYFVRLSAYSVAGLALLKLPEGLGKSVRDFFVWGVGILVVLGLLQLLLVPDLRFLERLGWDPHINRLVSTFLDPNLLAGFLLIPLGYIAFQWLEKGNNFWLLWTALVLLSIILTDSQSGWLALGVVLIFILLVHFRQKLLLFLAGGGVLLVQLTPLIAPHIPALQNIDNHSVQVRLQNWETGTEMFKTSPVFGIGYNNIRVVRDRLQQSQPRAHATGGFDSSFLTVLVTTGALGGLLFLWFLTGAFIRTGSREDVVSKTFTSALPGILVSGLFVNLFFYAPMLLVLFMTLGLSLKDN